jgi:regulator of protease activity HflC (stomatin/prohibitin superfamily)
MGVLIAVVIIVVLLALAGVGLGVRIVTQYEQGVMFRLGRLRGTRGPGFQLIIPVVDVLRRVSLRIVTLPIQSQGIITLDNVSVDVSAVAYYKVVDAVKSVVAIENVRDAIDQIAQTTLRKVVGQHSLDQTLSETDKINVDIRKILDGTTVDWGVEVTLVELKDIQLPDSMKRAMARQAEAEREKRAKIINAEGESLAAAALGEASDTMMAHPLALQLRNLQSLVEIGVDKNTTVVFPAPLMSTIAELGSFLASEQAAAASEQAAVTRALPPSSDNKKLPAAPSEAAGAAPSEAAGAAPSEAAGAAPSEAADAARSKG